MGNENGNQEMSSHSNHDHHHQNQTSPERDVQSDYGADLHHEAHAPLGVADTRAGHSEIAQHDYSGHGSGSHAGHEELFRRRFWITLVLSIPVVLFSPMVQDWLGYSMPSFTGSDLISPILGTIIFLYGGSVFLSMGWAEVKQRQPGMMLLISLAILVAFIASAATTFGFFDLDFWWELALLVVIMLLGHWLEMRAVGQASGALSALASLLPDEANRIEGDDITVVPASDVRVGDLLLVRPGARVPADGVIVSGDAELDESLITGESQPVVKGPGDHVIAGTVVAGSSLRVRVDAVGDATALAGIQRLVDEAQQSRSRAQALADRFAAALFYIAVAAGVITFVIWALIGEIDDAVVRTVTVLVISCPHALGLAIPLVIALSTSISARQGILIKDRLALERMRLVNIVLFDKTGTLTLGQHAVADFTGVDGDNDRLLALAAAVERDSEHPLARAIVHAAEERGLSIPIATEFRAVAGRGVGATVGEQAVAVGGPVLLRERGLSLPEALHQQRTTWEARGASVLYVIRNHQIVGMLALEDQIRPESRAAIDDLHQQGLQVAMITGDTWPVAEAVAAELGIDEVFAEVVPEEKDQKVAALQARGKLVAMVGDGVNDAPALARADVGIAIGAGTDVAIEAAGVILATSDPRAVSGVLKLSRASYRKMLQNLGWAAGYNLVAIPLAAGVLAPVGIVLAPAVGAILMSASTIIVALNAQLLRGLKLW
jgi:Cu2+-exporting ATPase